MSEINTRMFVQMSVEDFEGLKRDAAVGKRLREWVDGEASQINRAVGLSEANLTIEKMRDAHMSALVKFSRVCDLLKAEYA